MLQSTLILSSDNIRGALILKTLQKNNLDATLCRNLFDAYEIIKKINPRLLIIDREGFYPNELSVLSSLSNLLRETYVLIVSNKADYGLISIKALSTDWCICNPLDLDMITTKAVELLTHKSDDTLKNLLPIEKDEDNTEETDEGKLEEDLMGYLGLK